VFPLKDNIPTRRFPLLTVLLIVANIVMFFGFQDATLFGGVDEQNAIEYGAIPAEISHPGEQCARPAGSNALICGGAAAVEREVEGTLPPTWLTLLTSMFMHGGLLHIGGNMLFLWIFGNNIEDSMGRLRFISFYILGGLVALLAQTAISPDSAVPTIGASGAVAAVLGGYALLYPRARILTLVFIVFFVTLVHIPALLVLGLWFGLQLLSGSAELAQPLAGGGGGVAYFAHIGGFIFGLLAIKLFADRVHQDYDQEGRLPVY